MVGGRWLYPLLLAVQTIGAVIIYSQGLPLYRQLVAAPEQFESRTLERASWSLSAIALIQIAYWIRYRVRPPMPRFVNAAIGHVVLFFARLSFVLATSVFSFVFISRKPDFFQIPGHGTMLTLAVLFSLFCYTRELENLGKDLLGKENP
jgi:hypothetical protein